MEIDYNFVIYHGNCPDGIAAAWVCFNDANVDTIFHPGKFTEEPPNVEGKDVLFLDFSYNLDTMIKLLNSAESITVLDHHESALDLIKINNPKFRCVIDKTRSGCQIAWDTFMYEEELRPWFIDDIADRDLWKWKIPNSKFTTRGMAASGYYKSIEKFSELQDLEIDRKEMETIGRMLCQQDENIEKSICKSAVLTTFFVDDQEYKVKLVGCSHNFTSNVGNLLSEEKDEHGNYVCDFAAMFIYDFSSDQWWISLRGAEKSNINLSSLAKKFGGGGHAKAAGFTIYGNKGENLHTYFSLRK